MKTETLAGELVRLERQPSDVATRLRQFATKPLPTGSIPTAKTMGITVVACLTDGTALPTVTITSTSIRTISAAISA